MEASAESPGQQEPVLSNRDVDQLLTATSRTRQRIRKACYPCNKRKIKCDRDERTPCTNCAKRPHPELCTFDDHAPRSNNPRPRPSISHRPSSHSPAISQSVGLPTTPGHPILHGIHSASAAYTQAPHTNGGAQEYSPWGRPQNGTEVVTGTPGPSSVGTGYNLVGSSAPNSAKAPIGIPPLGRSTYSGFQPINPTYTSAERQSGLWHQINPLLAPQKHLLRYVHECSEQWRLR
jgi:Fungal Zn(2)-Cys(6) binuclear cluster domain